MGAPGVVSVGAGQEEEEEEEAGADREPDGFLQDSLRTPIRSNGPPDEDLEWLTELLKTPPPKQARPASPPSSSDDLTSEEQLQMLFNDSVAECKGLPVTHWNFDENKVHRALHDLVDDAAFYIGATVNPRRRYLGGESRGGLNARALPALGTPDRGAFGEWHRSEARGDELDHARHGQVRRALMHQHRDG